MKNINRPIMLFVCFLFVASIPHSLWSQDIDVSLSESEYTVMLTISDNWAYNDIYALSPDDLEPIPLITEAFAQFPVASPQNGDIAFVSLSGFSTDIMVFHIDERNFVNLTRTGDAHELMPRWSPDGERIAFATDVTGDWEVFVINRDGSELTNLSNNPDADDGGGLDWSPDGTQIVFTSNRNGRNGIYVMDVDGSNQHLLLPNDPPSLDTSPVWSPISNQIAFISHRAEGYGIFLVNDDGSNLTYIPTPTGIPGNLSWSPDGIHLAFEVFTDGVNSIEIYLIELDDGSNPIRLTDNDLYDAYPAWIPVSVLESDVFPIALPEAIRDSSHEHDG